jgi:hypothetical protein
LEDLLPSPDAGPEALYAADTGLRVNTLLSRKRYALACASDCAPFTTNLRKHKDPNMRKSWTWLAPLAILAMLAFIAVGGRSSAARLELAAAASVRLARNFVLAGARNFGAVPDSVWQIWRTPLLSPRIPTSLV